MELNNNEKEILQKELLKRYQVFSFIDSQYIRSLIEALTSDSNTFDGIEIKIDKDLLGMKPSFYYLFKAEDIINIDLVNRSKNDATIMELLCLKFSHLIDFYCKKLRVERVDSDILYVKEVIENFNCTGSLEKAIREYLALKLGGERLSKFINNKEASVKKVNDSKDAIEGIQPDFIVRYYDLLGVNNYINENDKDYLEYINLRFGYYNGKYFSLESISKIMGIDYIDILGFEKRMILFIRQIINERIESYILSFSKV